MPLRPVELATEYPCQVYPRVSTPEQKKNVSAEMQQDKSFATLCGWTDDGVNIIMDTRDLGLSGQLKMEERPAFVDMLRRIAGGAIKVVIAAQVDRLFRDRWGAEYSKFMEICYTYGVKVVTPNPWRTGVDFVYDFSIPWHVDKFRRKCEEAWSYLENHVYGRMLAAQEELWSTGYWSGGNLPIGYVVDRREKVDGSKNPNYRKYVSYEPHAKVVCWLFERYRETGGQLTTLLREIERFSFLFPAFESNIDEGIINKFTQYTTVLGENGKVIGYTIASDNGLRSLLSNPAYMGYWVHKGVGVKSENHQAIVEYGPFIYAFNRLSVNRLDGTPNNELLEKRQQYIKKYFPDRPAYLKNHLTSADPQYRIYTCAYPLLVKGTKGQQKRVENFYGFYPFKDAWARYTAKYMIVTRDVDNIFMARFKYKLEETDEFESFLEHEEKELKEQKKFQEDTARDIRAVESSMNRIKEDIKSGRIKNFDLLEALDEQYTNLETDLLRLQKIHDKTTKDKNHVQQRRSYKKMMHDAGEAWEEIVLSEEVPLMIDTFVKKVILEPLTPHFYKMIIHWYDPEWGIDEALCYRDGNASIQWTEEEDAILRQHYGVATREELMRLLPARNIVSIRSRAHKYKIKRYVNRPEPAIPNNFCLEDWHIMQANGLSESELNAVKGGKSIKWFFQRRP